MEFIGGAEVAIDAEAIERELEALWVMTTGQLEAKLGPGSGDEEALTTRASARNLVVPCSRETAMEARAVVAEVVNTHPARVLFLLLEHDAGAGAAAPHLRASVSAFCHRLGSARRHVCCEWIELLAHGAAVDHLPTAVLSLLEADLPVALWWPGDTADHPSLWGGLARLSDIRVLDSAAGRDTDEVRQITARAASEAAPWLHGAVHDLAWMRLMPWRELTAQFFDPRAFRPLLAEIDTLEVWSSLDESPATTPYLWIAWMAQRLGWEPIAESGEARSGREADSGGGRAPGASGPSPGGATRSATMRFTRPDGEGVARILPPRQAGLRPGELEGVRLSASSSERTFTIQHDPSAACATLTISTPGACPLPRTVSLRQKGTPALIASALDAPRADPLYASALQLVTRLRP